MRVTESDGVASGEWLGGRQVGQGRSEPFLQWCLNDMIQNENMSVPTQGSDSRFKVPEREAGLNCKVNFMHHMADHLWDAGATSKVEPDIESDKTSEAFKMSVWLLWKMNLRKTKGRNRETNCPVVLSYLTGNSQEPWNSREGHLPTKVSRMVYPLGTLLRQAKATPQKWRLVGSDSYGHLHTVLSSPPPQSLALVFQRVR